MNTRIIALRPEAWILPILRSWNIWLKWLSHGHLKFYTYHMKYWTRVSMKKWSHHRKPAAGEETICSLLQSNRCVVKWLSIFLLIIFWCERYLHANKDSIDMHYVHVFRLQHQSIQRFKHTGYARFTAMLSICVLYSSLIVSQVKENRMPWTQGVVTKNSVHSSEQVRQGA